MTLRTPESEPLAVEKTVRERASPGPDLRARAAAVERHWAAIDGAAALRAAAELERGYVVENGLEPPREEREAAIASLRQAGKALGKRAGELGAVAPAVLPPLPAGMRPASHAEWDAGAALVEDKADAIGIVARDGKTVDGARLRQALAEREADGAALAER